jgi:hypothetical protein
LPRRARQQVPRLWSLMTRAVLEAGLSFAILTPGDFLRRLVGGSRST